MSLNLKTTLVTTTPYNVLATDTVILVDVGSPSSIVLPATGTTTGEDCCGNKIKHDDDNNSCTPAVTLRRSYYIKDFSGLSQTQPITITSAGGKTIDGISFALINAGYGHIQVVYDGTNWKIIS